MCLVGSVPLVAEEAPDYRARIETQLFSLLLSWYHHESDPDVKNALVRDYARTSFIYYMENELSGTEPNPRAEKIIRKFISIIEERQRAEFSDPFRWNQNEILRFVSPYELTAEDYEKNVQKFLIYFEI
jgi:hypothetical protein